MRRTSPWDPLFNRYPLATQPLDAQTANRHTDALLAMIAARGVAMEASPDPADIGPFVTGLFWWRPSVRLWIDPLQAPEPRLLAAVHETAHALHYLRAPHAFPPQGINAFDLLTRSELEGVAEVATRAVARTLGVTNADETNLHFADGFYAQHLANRIAGHAQAAADAILATIAAHDRR